MGVAEKVRLVVDQIETVIVGKRDVVELALTAFLCGGHLLIEDIPGVGKTTLAKALARALALVYKRVQFTPDLLPADITGSSIFNQKTAEFEFREGPIFANIVLADEINRATPRTQSSLLECMEERQVTADGITYELPRPFFVIATENDIEAQGTYPLPEAQMDRFVMRLSIGYPDRADEARILARQTRARPLDALEAVIPRDEILVLQDEVRAVYVDESVRDYIVGLVSATRTHPQVQLGASPRGSLYLLHAAQASAALAGRTFVLPDDVKRLAVSVLSHRLILRPDARLKARTAETIIQEIVGRVPVPATL
ncbi:MAG: MoxR family ATPase [Armatimonadetes bacterium]|nr:MoxR family ATPase [Armatimonadota bacterium]